MAEDQKKPENDEFDPAEIDELPDVVLGEKTRAMRVVRDTPEADTENASEVTENHDADDDEIPASVIDDDPRVDNELDEALNAAQSSQADTGSLPAVNGDPDSQDANKVEEAADQIDSSDDTNELPAGAYHNDNEDDDEIPASVIDDDPRVDNELDEALKPKKSSHDETDPLPPVSDELSKVYENKDETAVTGKHVRSHTGAQPVTEKGSDTEETDPVHSASEGSETERSATSGTTGAKKEKVKKKKRKAPLNQRIVTIILVILMILLGVGIYRIWESLQPVSEESEPVSFQVNDGETIGDVTASLAREGIIRNAQTGYYYARFTHLTDVKRGVFQLDKSWSLRKIFTYLNDDKAADQDAAIVTLTEGDWAKDMADKISKATNVKSDDLMALWNNDDYIRTNLMPKYPFLTDDIFNENIKCDLEGYLAPDTYTFNKETTAQEVTGKILDQTNTVYQKHADAIQKSGYSTHQIYTLASIVQGESSRTDQMKRIAGVFYNRLKKDMPLQSSVTTCYIIDFDKGKTDWQECEASYNTQKQDPYNTYLNKGLPPGPVQNPGEDAINAVLNPDQNDDLFFMADVCGNTGIHYAKTEAEHEANVAKYNTCN